MSWNDKSRGKKETRNPRQHAFIVCQPKQIYPLLEKSSPAKFVWCAPTDDAYIVVSSMKIVHLEVWKHNQFSISDFGQPTQSDARPYDEIEPYIFCYCSSVIEHIEHLNRYESIHCHHRWHIWFVSCTKYVRALKCSRKKKTKIMCSQSA